MDEPFITAPFYPPSSLVKGLIVNKVGAAVRRRGLLPLADVVPRDAAAGRRGVPHRRQRAHGGAADAAGARSSTARRRSRRWRTASACPTGSLVATLPATTSTPPRGEDPDFHKHPDWLAPQDTGPWGVYDLTLGKALYAGFTLGGMRIDVDGEVLRDDGSVIPGLYAAGACASNIAQDGAGYCSGTQLGEGSFFGRRAGRHAAARFTGQPGNCDCTG